MGVVSSRSLFHSALYLILSLFGVAGYYVLLSAGFLAVIQLMVYIGAIAILILFAIMFSRGTAMDEKHEGQANQQWWISLPIVMVMFLSLIGVLGSVKWPIQESAPAVDMVQNLGVAFLSSYLIPFEVVSVLLSVALIGAVMLAREETSKEMK